MSLFRTLVLCILISTVADSVTSAQTSIQTKKAHKATDTVGTVNDFPITLRDFRLQLNAVMKEHITEIKDRKVSDTAYTRFVNIAWDKLVGDILVDLEIKKNHWNVSNLDAVKRLQSNPPKELSMSFTDSLGKLHPDEMKLFLEDPAPDSLRDQVVAYYATMYEQTDFLKKLSPKATTEQERKQVYIDWLNKQVAIARIDDRRTAFGFY